LYANTFLTRFSAEKDLSDVAFVSGKTIIRPKTFQTPENTIFSLPDTDSFDKIFMALWQVVHRCRTQASSQNSQGVIDGGVDKAGMSTAAPNRSAVLCG